MLTRGSTLALGCAGMVNWSLKGTGGGGRLGGNDLRSNGEY